MYWGHDSNWGRNYVENERAENIVLASSPQLAACPEKQTVAGR